MGEAASGCWNLSGLSKWIGCMSVAGLMISAVPAQASEPVARAALAPTPAEREARSPVNGDVQVADEIIRRLRRLGWNFNHSRVNRPYDPEGELC